MKNPPLFIALLVVAARLLAADPAEGKWFGTVGDSNNRSLLGFEITSDPKGGLQWALTLEMLNYYGVPLGPLAVQDGRYTSAAPFADLQLQDGKLTGTFGGARRAVAFERVDNLPSDPPIPRDLPAGPGPRWQTTLGGSIYAPAAVRDGHAYVGTTGGVFVAVKTADGSVVWNFPAGRPIFGEALATDDAVYFTCDNGWLFKLNRADGKEAWRYDLGDARAVRILANPVAQVPDGFDHQGPRPVLADGVLYVGAGDGGFHAVRADTGERVWRIQSKGAIRTTAALAGDRLVFSTMGGLVVMAGRADGKEVWQVDMKAPVTSSPVFLGVNLVIGGRNSLLQALDPADGKQLWRIAFWGSWVESTPVDGGDGLAYIGASDHRRITCFDPKDGRIVWRTDVFGAPWGRPALTEKFVYEGAAAWAPYNIRHEGGLVALDRLTGRLAWRWPLPNPPGVYAHGLGASPVISEGLLLIGGLNGTLYAFPAE
jgi:outer membrane protein assembly factor BamB